MPTGRVPALDGLRGCAILLVIIWHYFHTDWFPGWIGVDLFFVLSGYLITARLLQTIHTPSYFSRFYRNRILRVFPLYYAVVIPYLIAVFYLVQKQNFPTVAFYHEHWKSLLLFTTNWTFVLYGLPKDFSLVPLWSIAIEEQFYLIWPLLLFLVRPKFRIRQLVIGISLVLLARTAAWLYFPSLRNTEYYNTFFRLDSLFCGSLLCLLQQSGLTCSTSLIKKIVLALLAILLIGIGLTHDAGPQNAYFSTAGFTVNALLFACLTHIALHPGSKYLTRLLEFSPLRFIGNISYCLYLVHVPILLNIGPRLYHLGLAKYPTHTLALHWTSVFLCLLLSLLVSTLSYLYFESIFLRLKK